MMQSLLHVVLNRSAVADVAIVAAQVVNLKVTNDDDVAIFDVSFTVTAEDVTTYATRVPYVRAKLNAYLAGDVPLATFFNHGNHVSFAKALNTAVPALGAATLTLNGAALTQYDPSVDAIAIAADTSDSTTAKDMITGAVLGFVVGKAAN